jgi:hypothetical protein
MHVNGAEIKHHVRDKIEASGQFHARQLISSYPLNRKIIAPKRYSRPMVLNRWNLPPPPPQGSTRAYLL